MICKRCKKQIDNDERLVECIPTIMIDKNKDKSIYDDSINILRFCETCWLDMLTYLLDNNQL